MTPGPGFGLIRWSLGEQLRFLSGELVVGELARVVELAQLLELVGVPYTGSRPGAAAGASSASGESDAPASGRRVDGPSATRLSPAQATSTTTTETFASEPIVIPERGGASTRPSAHGSRFNATAGG